MKNKLPLIAPILLALLFTPPMAQAQAPGAAFCASDGQPRPLQLLERFVNADCQSCWQDPATPSARPGQLVLDWVLAGQLGEDAPQAPVASQEALERLTALGLPVPAGASAKLQTIKGVRGLSGATLRVAHGLPLSGYVGASIALRPVPAAAKTQRWTAWLALVETLPVGTEGSPVERNLLRNVFHNTFQPNRDERRQLLKTEHTGFLETRSMSVAPAVNPERLRVIGWVQDGKGRLVAAAQSRCAPAAP